MENAARGLACVPTLAWHSIFCGDSDCEADSAPSSRRIVHVERRDGVPDEDGYTYGFPASQNWGFSRIVDDLCSLHTHTPVDSSPDGPICATASAADEVCRATHPDNPRDRDNHRVASSHNPASRACRAGQDGFHGH